MTRHAGFYCLFRLLIFSLLFKVDGLGYAVKELHLQFTFFIICGQKQLAFAICLSVSKKSTRSRGTNTITAAKPCSAFFPRLPLFSQKPAPQETLSLLTAGFLSRCHSDGACPPA